MTTSTIIEAQARRLMNALKIAELDSGTRKTRRRRSNEVVTRDDASAPIALIIITKVSQVRVARAIPNKTKLIVNISYLKYMSRAHA